MLELQRLAGNAATSGLILAREPDPAAISPESIRAALAEVTVKQTTQQDTGLQPWEIFEHAPRNNQKKKKLYGSFKSALGRVQKARAAVEGAKKALAAAKPDLAAAKLKKLTDAVPTAEKALEKALKAAALARTALKTFIKGKVAAWSPDPKLGRLEDDEDAKEKALKQLKKARKKDPAAIKTAETELADARKLKKARIEEIKQEVENDPMEAGTFTRNRYTITVGDTTVRLHDHVEAYATIIDKGLEGSATRSATTGSKTVDELVDADATISASNKAILKLVSSFEGKFSSVNTWDIADVTWGFIQWTTGQGGKGSLIDTLLACKAQSPDAFRARLSRYGIDVEKSRGIVLTLPDGTVKTGKEAAKHIQVDPTLTAILSASGEDPEFKVAQLRHANDKVGKEVLRSKITIAGKTVKLGEILTSELAVGGAFNRAVHAGAGAVRELLTKELGKWAKKEKIDTSKPVSEWAAAADAAAIAALRVPEPDRMNKMDDKLSATPGSYQ